MRLAWPLRVRPSREEYERSASTSTTSPSVGQQVVEERHARARDREPAGRDGEPQDRVGGLTGHVDGQGHRERPRRERDVVLGEHGHRLRPVRVGEGQVDTHPGARGRATGALGVETRAQVGVAAGAQQEGDPGPEVAVGGEADREPAAEGHSQLSRAARIRGDAEPAVHAAGGRGRQAEHGQPRLGGAGHVGADERQEELRHRRVGRWCPAVQPPQGECAQLAPAHVDGDVLQDRAEVHHESGGVVCRCAPAVDVAHQVGRLGDHRLHPVPVHDVAQVGDLEPRRVGRLASELEQPEQDGDVEGRPGGDGRRLEEVQLEEPGEEVVDDPRLVEVVLGGRELDRRQVHDGPTDGQGQLGEGRGLVALVGLGVGGEVGPRGEALPDVADVEARQADVVDPRRQVPAQRAEQGTRAVGQLADRAGRGEDARDTGEQCALDAHESSLRVAPTKSSRLGSFHRPLEKSNARVTPIGRTFGALRSSGTPSAARCLRGVTRPPASSGYSRTKPGSGAAVPFFRCVRAVLRRLLPERQPRSWPPRAGCPPRPAYRRRP